MIKHHEKQCKFEVMTIDNIFYAALLHVTEQDYQKRISDSTMYTAVKLL